MSEEQYYFAVSEEGQKGLDLLDYCSNETTRSFLQNAGLEAGMKILDIGCGTGAMTSWLCQQVGNDGKVIAIDNHESQIQATQKRLSGLGLTNYQCQCISAYDINELNETFDLVYCRFVLHHIVNPTSVIEAIYQILKPDGVYAAEEGLVSQAFTYPFTEAWGSERWQNRPEDHHVEGSDRDGNYGMKLFYTMYQTGFQNLRPKLIQPILSTREEKSLMLAYADEEKATFLQQGYTEAQWQEHYREKQRLVENDAQLVAFYQSYQVSGIKPEQ